VDLEATKTWIEYGDHSGEFRRYEP
jgi:hypothetical protein